MGTFRDARERHGTNPRCQYGQSQKRDVWGAKSESWRTQPCLSLRVQSHRGPLPTAAISRWKPQPLLASHLLVKELAGVLLNEVEALDLPGGEAHKEGDGVSSSRELVEVVAGRLRPLVNALVDGLVKVQRLREGGRDGDVTKGDATDWGMSLRAGDTPAPTPVVQGTSLSPSHRCLARPRPTTPRRRLPGAPGSPLLTRTSPSLLSPLAGSSCGVRGHRYCPRYHHLQCPR